MLPLKGIKVLDLTRIVAGPYCSMLLGDMGADIIKIENTSNGDYSRQWGPPFANEDSIYFWSINRNKRSVCVDFSVKEGNDIIKGLASKCDVLIENFIPNTLSKYGLDYNSIQKQSPNLIYCSITGFGQQGPISHQRGLDVIASGIGGLLHITGPVDGPPCRVGVPVTDMMTGMFAQSSILAALVARLGNPQAPGVHIDCNLLSTQISMLFHIGANYLSKNMESSRLGTAHAAVVPYQAFPTKDSRYFIVGTNNDKQFTKLCQLVQLQHLAEDALFKTNPGRVANRSQLIPMLEKQFATESLQYWLDTFSSSGMPNGPVNDVKQAFNDPQVKFLSDTLVNSWLDTHGNTVSVPGFPVRFSGLKVGSSPTPPPKLGEHTREVLSSMLQYSEEKINELNQSGVIRTRN